MMLDSRKPDAKKLEARRIGRGSAQGRGEGVTTSPGGTRSRVLEFSGQRSRRVNHNRRYSLRCGLRSCVQARIHHYNSKEARCPRSRFISMVNAFAMVGRMSGAARCQLNNAFPESRTQ